MLAGGGMLITSKPAESRASSCVLKNVDEIGSKCEVGDELVRRLGAVGLQAPYAWALLKRQQGLQRTLVAPCA